MARRRRCFRHGPHDRSSTPAASVIRDADATAPRTLATRSAPCLARARPGHGSGGRRCGAGGPRGAARRAQPDQLRAVTHGGGPLLVVAGAGTGKTEVITRRIAWLIATRRAKPSEILALTSPDKAAEEMAVRRRQASCVRLHGHRDLDVPCLRRQPSSATTPLELGLPTRPAGADRPEVVIFLREHLFEFDPRRLPAAGRPDPPSWPRSRRCSAVARTRTSPPADYMAHAGSAGRRGGPSRRGRRRRGGDRHGDPRHARGRRPGRSRTSA
jgi:hypothetical protein